jgi:uncharacterized membrane protein
MARLSSLFAAGYRRLAPLWPRCRFWVAAALIVGFAIALRLINLGAEPYWGDEILSVEIARRFASAGEMMRYLREVEFHPPLYYLMLRPWMELFGAGAAATRALSLVFSAATVAAAAWLGHVLFRRKAVALLAAFIVAVLPLQVEFGQEARPYAMVVFAAVVATAAMWRHLRSGRWHDAALFALASLLGLYWHYSFVLIAAALAGWWLVEIAVARAERPRLLRGFFLAHAAVALGFMPWLDAFLLKFSLSPLLIHGWPRFTDARRSVGFADEAVNLLGWLNMGKTMPQIAVVSQLLAKVAAAVMAVTLAYRLGRSRATWPAVRPYAFLSWLCVVGLILFAASPLSTPYAPLYIRHVIALTVFGAVLLAGAAVALGRVGWYACAAALVTFVPALATVVGNDGEWDSFHRVEYVGAYISEQAAPGDLVVINRSAARVAVAHYVPETIPVVALVPLNYYGRDWWASRTTLGFLENESQVRGYRLGEGVELPDDGRRFTEAAVHRKLDRFVELYDPGRIWVFGVRADERQVHGWFADRGWRHAFPSLGPLFQLDLYVRPSAEE